MIQTGGYPRFGLEHLPKIAVVAIDGQDPLDHQPLTRVFRTVLIRKKYLRHPTKPNPAFDFEMG